MRIDSGWNWTASIGSSRWRTPMMTPSSVRAVISRHCRKLLRNRVKRVIAAYAELLRQPFEHAEVAVPDQRRLAVHRDSRARLTRRRTLPPCLASRGTLRRPEFRASRRGGSARERRNPPGGPGRAKPESATAATCSISSRGKPGAIGHHFGAGLARVVRERVDEAVFVIDQQQAHSGAGFGRVRRVG